jgi:hypothetical protein
MDPNVHDSWERFLDPATLRSNLIRASTYIASYEILKETIIERIRGFFLIGFDESGYKIAPEYQSDVLSRNSSPAHASLDWLREQGAINSQDMAVFEKIKDCRNKLAHELLVILSSEGLPTDFDNCFHDMAKLLHKIEFWWIKEVDIPTDPAFDGKEIDDTDIVPGGMMVLQLLCDVALGNETASRLYIEEFRKRFGHALP